MSSLVSAWRAVAWASAFAASFAAWAGPSERDFGPCKTAANASGCFHARGRLWSGNGTPSFRFWPFAGHHVYGIWSSAKARAGNPLDCEAPRLPKELDAFAREEGIVAEFEVCHIEPFVEGALQAACIASAAHIHGVKKGAPYDAWPTPSLDEAEAAIRRASGFWGVVEGIDGHPTPAVAGYRVLLKAADGKSRFLTLAREARIGGRLYALCGLFMLDSKAFAAELERLWQESEGVEVDVGLYDGSRGQELREVLGAPAPHGGHDAGGGDLLDIASGAPCRYLATQPLPRKPN